MSEHRAQPRPPVRPLLATALIALVTLTLGSSTSLSDWAHANVTNATNLRPVGALTITHTYAAGPSCSAGVSTTSAACTGTLISGNVPASGGLSATDSIANIGDIASASLSQTVAAASCAPVQFANSKNSGNPVLARYGTTFDTGDANGPMGGVGYATLDGATPGGYATAVTAQTQPGGSLLSAGTISGIGVWFKASSGSSGPLLSFGANSDNTTGGNWDRVLSMNSSGQLTFFWNTGGSSIGPSSSGYANGAWHYAYISLGGINVVLIGLIPQVTLYVDGSQVATTPLISLSPFSAYSGYWHLGYAPTATTGLSTAYFKGWLSNAVVFDGSSFPTATTVPSSASTFATYATNATEWWPLNDSGTTTYTGTLPSVGAGSSSPVASAACKSLDLGWSFTSPSGTATTTSTSLYTLVTSGATAVAAPGAGGTQTATLALSHDAAYSSYVAGLHLYVPLSSTISTVPGNKWPLTFSWSPGATTTIVPTP